MATKESKQPGYEISDFKRKNVFNFIAISISVVVVVVIVSYYLFLGVRSNFVKKYQQEASMESMELQIVRSVSAGKLQGYKWVDPKNDIVQIPIEKAMEKVIKQYQQK